MKQRPLKVIHAAAVRDATGVSARPGAVLVSQGRVHAAGDPATFNRELVELAEHIHRPDCLLLPKMVNAHCHLELTDLGPQSYDPAGGFMGWVKQVRSQLPNDPAWFVESAHRGAAMMDQSGVQAVGDIAGSEAVGQAVAESGMWGFTYSELFGLGPPYDADAIQSAESLNLNAFERPIDVPPYTLRQGYQPHAPYSAGPSVFERVSSRYHRCSTHLAETMDEAAFVAGLEGAILEYVKSLGRWEDAFAEYYGHGQSPVQWMRPFFEASLPPRDSQYGNWLVAHCNYVSDEDIALLAEMKVSVAYCPIASEYFGHTEHRYRDMLAAGVNVCLGTDSIVCARPDDPQPLGLLSAMRRLYQRDGTDADTLLKMATANGALALCYAPHLPTLKQKARANFALIQIDPDDPTDPLEQALINTNPVEAISFGVIPDDQIEYPKPPRN